MSYNKVIAFTRARDSENTNISILKFIQSRLIATLGPCGKGKEDENGVTRFYFDTFRGIVIPIKPLLNGLSNDDILLFDKSDDKTKNIVGKFKNLGGAYCKIEETTNTSFSIDFLPIIKEFLSLCGGGIMRIETENDTNDVNYQYLIINGAKFSDEDKEKALLITKKIVDDANVFKENESEKVLEIGFDGLPIGYFCGLANVFLSTRCVIVEELTKEHYTRLKKFSSLINATFLEKYQNPFLRSGYMVYRLNAINFIQYLIQILKLEINNIETIKENMESNIYCYQDWLQGMEYDEKKNTKGIIEIFENIS